MFDAFDGLEHLRELPHFPGLASDSDDLEAIGVIEMDVLRRYYDFLMIVLQVHYLVQEPPVMMVIDKGDRAGDLRIHVPFLFYQFLSYEVPEGLGTIGIVLFLSVPVKFLQKLIIEGDAESDKFWHFLPAVPFFCKHNTIGEKIKP